VSADPTGAQTHRLPAEDLSDAFTPPRRSAGLGTLVGARQQAARPQHAAPPCPALPEPTDGPSHRLRSSRTQPRWRNRRRRLPLSRIGSRPHRHCCRRRRPRTPRWPIASTPPRSTSPPRSAPAPRPTVAPNGAAPTPTSSWTPWRRSTADLVSCWPPHAARLGPPVSFFLAGPPPVG
jgi:hypothetical protein